MLLMMNIANLTNLIIKNGVRKVIEQIKFKIKESFSSIMPITLIVLLLSISLVNMQSGTFMSFVVGAIFLIVGMALFGIGADLSMLTIGSKLGKRIAQSKNIWIIAFISLIIGIIVTVSEPDLSILANQVNGVQNMVLILTVSVGVGIFLCFAVLRIIFKIPLNIMLIILYTVIFVLTFFVPKSFIAVSFDAGGVTTGPMTVPFIMSLGVGIASISSSKGSQDDSFGLVALCSVGPILSTMILGIVFKLEGGSYELSEVINPSTTKDVLFLYGHGIFDYMKEVGFALCPIIVFFILFQLINRPFSKKQLIRICIGLLFTYIGLVLFLTGANVGFMPIGIEIGRTLGGIWHGILLVPLGLLIGYFVVSAEPAIHVLTKQVEQMSSGAISASFMMLSLSIGVALAVGLAMLRVITGISILWFLIPLYIIALVLTFFIPKFFSGVAFDSGGVASGAMVSAFVLPMAIGACVAVGGNVMTDAFGCVAFVALTPIISIEISGLIYKIKSNRLTNSLYSEEETIIDYDEVINDGR